MPPAASARHLPGRRMKPAKRDAEQEYDREGEEDVVEGHHLACRRTMRPIRGGAAIAASDPRAPCSG